MTRPVNYLINSLTGLEGEPGIFYNYILAADGLYLRAKNPQLEVTVCIAPSEIRGLAALYQEMQLPHGKIPLYFLNLALSILCVKPDIEQYLAVTWLGNYSLNVPSQLQSAGSVTYETLPCTIMDIHSHVGGVPAHFSGVDNRDEQGLCLYTVVGDLPNLCPTIELRLGIYGYFMSIEKEDIFV
jgi:hypothetical protein